MAKNRRSILFAVLLVLLGSLVSWFSGRRLEDMEEWEKFGIEEHEYYTWKSSLRLLKLESIPKRDEYEQSEWDGFYFNARKNIHELELNHPQLRKKQ